MIIGRFRQFTDSFRLFVPTIEEYANHAEKGKRIEIDRRTETIEQMDANLAVLEKDIEEVLRVSREQKRL